jgi:hypothetical protein
MAPPCSRAIFLYIGIMTTLKNLSLHSYLQGATRQDLRNILKNPMFETILGPNKTQVLQTLRRLYKFLELYDESVRSNREWNNAHNGLNFPMTNAQRARINTVERNMNRIRNKARVLRNKIGLHVHRNTVPFNQTTIRNAKAHISRILGRGQKRQRNNVSRVSLN